MSYQPKSSTGGQSWSPKTRNRYYGYHDEQFNQGKCAPPHDEVVRSHI